MKYVLPDGPPPRRATTSWWVYRFAWSSRWSGFERSEG
jgi:hypothetical protein